MPNIYFENEETGAIGLNGELINQSINQSLHAAIEATAVFESFRQVWDHDNGEAASGVNISLEVEIQMRWNRV